MWVNNIVPSTNNFKESNKKKWKGNLVYKRLKRHMCGPYLNFHLNEPSIKRFLV